MGKSGTEKVKEAEEAEEVKEAKERKRSMSHHLAASQVN